MIQARTTTMDSVRRRPFGRTAVTCLSILVFVSGAGCQSLAPMPTWATPWRNNVEANETRAAKEKEERAKKFERPVRVVALWSPSVIAVPGKPPVRGFGGRLYFYNEKSETVPVDGQLIVYAYDDRAAKPTGDSGAPDRKFVFPQEKISEHFAPTDLGASYSVWVPWGPADGPTTEITLVTALTTAKGDVVADQGAKNNLPGKAAPIESKLQRTANPEVLFKSNADATDVSAPASRIQSTTIPVSRERLDAISRSDGNPQVATAAANATANREREIAPASATLPIDAERAPRQRSSFDAGATILSASPSDGISRGKRR